jgi:hypothetical protein
MPQMEIAGADFDPRIGHADDRPPQLLIVEADRFQHGAGGRALRPVSDRPTVPLAAVSVAWSCVSHLHPFFFFGR